MLLGNNSHVYKPIAKFITDRADCNIYQRNTTLFLNNNQQSTNVNREAAAITKAFHFAANLSIPQSKNIPQNHLYHGGILK